MGTDTDLKIQTWVLIQTFKSVSMKRYFKQNIQDNYGFSGPLLITILVVLKRLPCITITIITKAQSQNKTYKIPGRHKVEITINMYGKQIFFAHKSLTKQKSTTTYTKQYATRSPKRHKVTEF